MPNGERRDQTWVEQRIDRIEEKLDGLPDRLAIATATALQPITQHLDRIDGVVQRNSDRIQALEIWRATESGRRGTAVWLGGAAVALATGIIGALAAHYIG